MSSDLRRELEALLKEHGYGEFWYVVKQMSRQRLERGDRERRKPLSASKRVKLYVKQEGKCARCHQPFPLNQLTDDHIIPLSKGGTNDANNRRLVCRKCNGEKSDRSMVADSKRTGDTIINQLSRGDE